MAVMAIVQNIDKCIRCNGCYIACKRTWNMRDGDAGTRGLHKVAAYQRVVIKSQKKVDMGPFIRYSCWHCSMPPCAGRCPFNAIKKEANGAVSVDYSACNPNDTKCQKQCVTDCQRGGFPKVGIGRYSDITPANPKAHKCTMCFGRAGEGGDLPTKSTSAEITGEANLAHWPACVYTCPAKAMRYDTRQKIMDDLHVLRDAQVAAGKPFAAVGEGSMFWYTTKANAIVSPKADPFVEDHVTPMVSGILASPLAKAAIVPTLVLGGLMALSARRSENEKELEPAMEGEV